MVAEAEQQTFVDWRLEIIRMNLVGRKVEVGAVREVVDF
jgi:hypothetical protein